jgi:hypothetical protein
VSVATTHAYYNKASSIETSRLYASVLAELTPRVPRRAPPRAKRTREALWRLL